MSAPVGMFQKYTFWSQMNGNNYASGPSQRWQVTSKILNWEIQRTVMNQNETLVSWSTSQIERTATVNPPREDGYAKKSDGGDDPNYLHKSVVCP